MKKIVIITAVLFSLLTTASFSASANDSLLANSPVKSEENRSLKKQINRHIYYPIFQQKEMHGTVEVSFMINPEGKVKVLNIQSNNPDLVDYVLEKLKKIQLQEDDESVGKTIKYRFVFKKQA